VQRAAPDGGTDGSCGTQSRDQHTRCTAAPVKARSPNEEPTGTRRSACTAGGGGKTAHSNGGATAGDAFVGEALAVEAAAAEMQAAPAPAVLAPLSEAPAAQAAAAEIHTAGAPAAEMPPPEVPAAKAAALQAPTAGRPGLSTAAGPAAGGTPQANVPPASTMAPAPPGLQQEPFLLPIKGGGPVLKPRRRYMHEAGSKVTAQQGPAAGQAGVALSSSAAAPARPWRFGQGRPRMQQLLGSRQSSASSEGQQWKSPQAPEPAGLLPQLRQPLVGAGANMAAGSIQIASAAAGGGLFSPQEQLLMLMLMLRQIQQHGEALALMRATTQTATAVETARDTGCSSAPEVLLEAGMPIPFPTARSPAAVLPTLRAELAARAPPCPLEPAARLALRLQSVFQQRLRAAGGSPPGAVNIAGGETQALITQPDNCAGTVHSKDPGAAASDSECRRVGQQHGAGLRGRGRHPAQGRRRSG
jgi:hypothetical protein